MLFEIVYYMDDDCVMLDVMLCVLDDGVWVMVVCEVVCVCDDVVVD